MVRKMAARDRIPPDPTISRLDCPMEFADGAFRNSTIRQDRKNRCQADLLLGACGTLGPPPLFSKTSQPPRRRSKQLRGERPHLHHPAALQSEQSRPAQIALRRSDPPPAPPEVSLQRASAARAPPQSCSARGRLPGEYRAAPNPSAPPEDGGPRRGPETHGLPPPPAPGPRKKQPPPGRGRRPDHRSRPPPPAPPQPHLRRKSPRPPPLAP